jgi:hypothetical protein
MMERTAKIKETGRTVVITGQDAEGFWMYDPANPGQRFHVRREQFNDSFEFTQDGATTFTDEQQEADSAEEKKTTRKK